MIIHRWQLAIMLTLLMVACGVASAQQNSESEPLTFEQAVNLSPLDGIAVHTDGRIKSFGSHANAMMQFVTGPRKIAGQTPGFTYLDLIFRPARYRGLDAEVIYVKNKQVRDEIVRALAGSPVKVLPDFDERMARFFKTGLIAEQLLAEPSVQETLSRLQRDVLRTESSVSAISTAVFLKNGEQLRGRLAIVPPPGGGVEDPWLTMDGIAQTQMPIPNEAAFDSQLRAELVDTWIMLQKEWQSANASGVNQQVERLATLLPKVNSGVYPIQARLRWESWYFSSNNMTWIWLLYLLSIVVLLMSIVYRWPASRWLGALLFLVAFGFHTFALILRWYISERWPNANMFEALTTSAWLGGCFAILMEIIVRRTPMRNLFFLASAVASMVALLAVRLYPLQLNANISNRMPVLHDIWLYIHTNVIIFSYCLIFLAAVSAVLYLVYRVVRPGKSKRPGSDEYARVGGAGSLIAQGKDGTAYLMQSKTTIGQVLDGTTMILMELSFILLWAGLVMGAIWADHSWGRPWGWDPKEVFALETFIVLAILIHVRIKTKDKGAWTAILAIIGCAVMLFNWIIINFTIAGLHSYA
jgi:cytochrome c-type biogenesis protein CcsB